MNKRIGFLSLFGITALLLAMVGAITALATPSSAAVTGTVKLDKAWYTIATGGNTVKVTVEDADSNVTTAAGEDKALTNQDPLGSQGVTLTLGTGEEIVGTPKIMLASGVTSGVCTSTTADTNFSVEVFNAQVGTISVKNFNVFAGGTRCISYNKGSKNEVDVKITSTQESNGITVKGVETTVDSGKFEVTITLVDASDVTTVSSSTAKTLRSLHGDTVTAKYVDTTPASGTASVNVTNTAAVETLKVSFASILPADKFSTQAGTVTISGTINDSGGSGVKLNTIVASLSGSVTGALVPSLTLGSGAADGDNTVAFSATITTTTEETWTWFVTAKDVAGNEARSDSDATITSDQDHTFKIDKSAPSISSATTGKYWDVATSTVKSNRLNAVVVEFSEDVDGTSVAPTDFSVEGSAPTAADVFTAIAAGPNKVYLTLATNLAPNTKPVVAIATGGAVADKAGNALNTGSVTAKDGIAPTLSIALDVTTTKEKVVATITSNEAIAGVPSVTAYHSTHTIGTPVTQALAVVVKTSTSWEATFTKVSGKDGKWSVVATATDLASPANTGTKGEISTTAAAAITFTQDTTAPVATFTSGTVDFTAGTSSSPIDVAGAGPTLSVAFGEKVTVGKAEFGLSDATTLTDVLAQGTLSSDGKTFIYVASGLTKDKIYTLRVSATDVAGNKLTDKTASFKSKEIALPEIPLEPGQNIISFPGNPKDGDINVVFTSLEVTAVVTYDAKNPDPSTGSPWLIATRGADGKLSGSLKKVDGNHAYFVKSATFGSVKVDIATLGFDATPALISVAKGWNLMPVVSVEGKSPLAAGQTCAGTPAACVAADGYLSTIKWTTAYTYNPIPNLWTKIQPKTFSNLEIGAGYWVYVTEDGTLVP